MVAPINPRTRPPGSVPVSECELVQLAVYEMDAEPPDELAQEHYINLTDIQRTVFEEARAANGDLVHLTNETRMAAPDTLPHSVVLESRTHRAHSVRGNCFDRPRYIGLARPIGFILIGAGILVGGVFSWRRIAY